MKSFRYILIQCLFCFSVLACKSQTKIIDGLKKDILLAANPEKELQAILLLCDQGYSLHPDTLMAYSEEAKKLSLQLKDPLSEVKAMYHRSSALTNKGLIDSALNIANQCLEILESKVTDPLLLCNVINQKGRCYVRMNQYKEAVEMGYKIIGIAEKINDVLMQVKAKTLIGWAYLEMDQSREALNWHLKALRTTNDTLLLERYAILFANLAINYNGLGNIDSAFYYIKKGINYSRKHENLFALSNSLAIASQLYVRSGQAKLAEPVLQEVVAIRKLIGDPFYIASDMSQLGFYYAHYGQPEKGVTICNEGIAIARKYKLDTKLLFLYNSLADNYKAMGNTIKYAEVLEYIITLKDSVYEKNSAVALASIQTKYELQKKENTIIQQKLDLVIKNYWLYGSLILFIFSSLLAYVIFKDYNKRQKLKMQIALAEEKRLSTASIKEAEENERRRIAADLHDNLGVYAASIVANLDTVSAEHEFNSTTVNALKELNSNSQAIVSQLGDTIWALKRSALSLTAVSDRIKLVLQKVQPSYINIKMDVVEKIEKDFQLSPAQGFHLFQIIQEGVINALKHSNCSEIKVVFIADEIWEVIIEDNGTGMKTTVSNKGGGNGLSNMQQRSKEAGFGIEWRKNDTYGTRVVIHPTTN
jgi:two-component system, NarL family, sensor kinase